MTIFGISDSIVLEIDKCINFGQKPQREKFMGRYLDVDKRTILRITLKKRGGGGLDATGSV
jgi:hypothetical protein